MSVFTEPLLSQWDCHGHPCGGISPDTYLWIAPENHWAEDASGVAELYAFAEFKGDTLDVEPYGQWR